MKNSSLDKNEIKNFAKYGDEWWNLNGAFKTLHDINPTRLLFIEKHADLTNKNILDLGSGGGILSESMSYKAKNIVGLDAEEHAINAAKHHALENNIKNINYVCSLIENYEQNKNNIFDIITCMDLIEHVANPAIIIKNATRLLKEDGLLFISTINKTLKAYLGVILSSEYILNIIPHGTHDYNKFIKPHKLSAVMRDFGLEVISISGLYYNPFTRVASLQEAVDINYLMVCRKRNNNVV